jgi:hypothetical protein
MVTIYKKKQEFTSFEEEILTELRKLNNRLCDLEAAILQLRGI